MNVLLIDNGTAHLDKLQALLAEKLGEVSFTLRDPRTMAAADVAAAKLVIFSGGWGRSIIKNPETFRRMVHMTAEHNTPAIGICLGAEAIAMAYGAELMELPIRRVGNIRIQHHGPLAEGLAQDSAMVYEFHKWYAPELPAELEVLATSKDGVEVLRHRQLPLWGLQFHPEVRRLDNSGHLIFEHALRELGLLK